MDISKSKVDNLNFIIASYDNRTIYHEFDSKEMRLKPGQNLTTGTMKHLFKFVNNIENTSDYKFFGLIPKNVLSYSTDEKRVVWFTPAQTRELYFKKDCPIKTGFYPVPALIWKLVNNSLSVYAVKKEPKDIEEKTFQAPFFNISSNGLVCMGSANFITHSFDYEIIIDKVERGFFGSVFTHSTTNNLLEGNYIELMEKMQQKGSFDNKLLVKKSITLKNIIHGK